MERGLPRRDLAGSLPAEFPVAAYVQQRLVASFDESEGGNRVGFDMPHELELVFGGTFDKTFSFFGAFVLFEHGVNAPGLKRLFFQANDVMGPENFVNIRMGRFEPGITDGLVDNQRVMLEHATVLDYKATGKWRPRNQQSGIEINGIVGHNYQYAFGIVNGESKVLDDNTDEKDFYGRVAAKFGGRGLDGFKSGDLNQPGQTGQRNDNSVTIGTYFYHGNDLRNNVRWIDITPTDSTEVITSLDNNFIRYGIDLHLTGGRFDFYSGIISGIDDNPEALLAGTEKQKEIRSLAWFGEIYYLHFPWLIGGLRIGGVSSERDGNDLDNYLTISPNLTILARQNIRFTIEGLIRYERNKSDNAGNVLKTDNSDRFKWIKLNALFAF